MKILYCLAGVGFGNIARALAVLPHLDEHETHIVGPPKVTARFAGDYETTTLGAFEYPAGGALSAWRMVARLPLFARLLAENMRRYGALLDEWKPDVVVADSDVYVLLPARRRGIPLVAINQSPAVVAFFEGKTIPEGCAMSYHLLERVDRALAVAACHRVLVPSLPAGPTLGGESLRRVPLVSRFSRRLAPPPENGRVLVIYGGSDIAPEIDLKLLGPEVTLVGGGANFVEDLQGELAESQYVVSLGGLSTLGDLAALGRPALVVPIPGHAEQWANAALFEASGFGVHGSVRTLHEDLPRYRRILPRARREMEQYDVSGGSEIAAEISAMARC